MPLYDYECENCGIVEDVWAKMDEQQKLCSCGSWATRTICHSPANISPDWEPYLDPNLVPMHDNSAGQWVTSRQHRRELMKKYGLQECG